MGFNESNKKLNTHILGIRQLIRNPDLTGLLEESEKLGTRFIDAHNTEGRYLGGPYAEKGYSTTDLPLFFFGEATLVERTGNMRLSDPEKQVTNLLIRKQDIHWTTSNEGKRMAWLQGGYATFLRYTRPGKNLNKVDHTYSGAMLRNLTADLRIANDGGTVRWYVRPPHNRKAAWTHAKREWMGLFNDEIEMIARMAAEKFGLIIYDNLKVD